MKNKLKFLFIICLTFISLFSFNVFNVSADNSSVYLGGMPAGFSMEVEGAFVTGLSDVLTDKGEIVSPSKACGIKVGDIILSINENKIYNADSIIESVSDGEIKVMKIKRGDNYLVKAIKPVKEINGGYRLGIFVSGSVNGIGTITYIKGNKFASLGHPVLNDDGTLLKVYGGNLFTCDITGYVKGERGKAGELKGIFTGEKSIGEIEKNTMTGVYGKIDNEFFDKYNLTKIELGEGQIGRATVFTTINGNLPKQYIINIVKTDYDNKENKNFVIKINDEELLNATNGILQGMSGSPIVQNGKLIGAVTHVFINDSSRGFAIAIDKMMNE